MNRYVEPDRYCKECNCLLAHCEVDLCLICETFKDAPPFVFWTCPKKCQGRVEWNKDRTDATCLECGTRRSDKK